MTEITHAMQAALRETFVQRDHELRERALRLVATPRPSVGFEGRRKADVESWHHGQTLGAALWRLLDRLDLPVDASGRTTQESLQGAVDYLVDDLLRPLGGVADGAALTVPQLMLLMDDLKAHVLELRAENAELASLRELADQQATLLAGYREALANITDDAPHNGTETSKAAARSIAPRMNPMRMSILAALIRADPQGLTADEIERCTGMTGNSIRPRLVEMATLTWVSRGPEVRATKSGRDASVWHVTQAGDNAFTAAAHEASTTPS